MNSQLPTLKGLRVRYGLTQGELARLLFVSSNVISDVENGNKKPSLSLRKRIAKLFDVDMGTVSYQKSIPLPNLKEKKQINKKLAKHAKRVKKSKNPHTRMSKNSEQKDLLHFTLTKESFMYEIEVLREAPQNLSNAFMVAFSVLANDNYDWHTLNLSSGLSHSAVYKDTSKSKSRDVLVEFQLNTLLRLAYVPHQHLDIRKHFNYNVDIDSVKYVIKKALAYYHIDIKKVHHEIATVIKHGNAKKLARRMGVTYQALQNYQSSGFNVLSMTFREVVVLLANYRKYATDKARNKAPKTGVVTMLDKTKLHYIEKNNETYVLIPIEDLSKYL